jgi:hypothetical protein
MLINGVLKLRKFCRLQLVGEFLKDLYIKEIRKRVPIGQAVFVFLILKGLGREIDFKYLDQNG